MPGGVHLGLPTTGILSLNDFIRTPTFRAFWNGGRNFSDVFEKANSSMMDIGQGLGEAGGREGCVGRRGVGDEGGRVVIGHDGLSSALAPGYQHACHWLRALAARHARVLANVDTA